MVQFPGPRRSPDTPDPAGSGGARPADTGKGGSADDLAQSALKAAADAVADLQTNVSAAVNPAPSAPAQGSKPAAPSGVPLELPKFAPNLSAQQTRAIDLLSDVSLNVKIELGRTRMLVEDVLKLSEGAVVELDKLAGDPVDIFVNDRPVARGEVLVLNDAFCVSVNEILQSITEPDARSAGSRTP